MLIIKMMKNTLKITKYIFILLVIIILQSCKSPSLNFEWFLFEAEGSYSSGTITSYLKLNAWVKINQSTININPASPLDTTDFTNASVDNWRFLIYEGKNLVMEVNKQNLDLNFDGIYKNVAIDRNDYLYVAIVSETPLPGDIFKGMNPDSVIVEMSLFDKSGNTYFVTNSVSFNFQRN